MRWPPGGAPALKPPPAFTPDGVPITDPADVHVRASPPALTADGVPVVWGAPPPVAVGPDGVPNCFPPSLFDGPGAGPPAPQPGGGSPSSGLWGGAGGVVAVWIPADTAVHEITGASPTAVVVGRVDPTGTVLPVAGEVIGAVDSHRWAPLHGFGDWIAATTGPAGAAVYAISPVGTVGCGAGAIVAALDWWFFS